VVLDNALMCHICKFTSATSRLTAILKGSSHNESIDDDVDICCSFFSFRKLRCTKAGHVSVVGYLDPERDPRETEAKNDVDMWVSRPEKAPHDDVEKSKFILGLIGDQFCDMVRQEQKCVALHHSQQPEVRSVAWKRAVKNVREMCDVCKTTLFNFHWTCGRCGIVACLDCYQVQEHLQVSLKSSLLFLVKLSEPDS
jgi:lysine-specific demethylase 3